MANAASAKGNPASTRMSNPHNRAKRVAHKARKDRARASFNGDHIPHDCATPGYTPQVAKIWDGPRYHPRKTTARNDSDFGKWMAATVWK